MFKESGTTGLLRQDNSDTGMSQSNAQQQ